MLANYSSYIEVLAAVYTSMYIDKALTEFWAPDYFLRLKQDIDQYQLTGDDVLREKLFNENSVWISQLKNRMKRKAVFMFVIIVFILVFIGMENSIVTNMDTIQLTNLYNVILAVAFITTIVTTIFQHFLFFKWKYTIWSIVVLSCLFLLLWYGNWDFLSYMTPLSIYAAYIVLFLITLPIIWQLFVNWIYSSAYSGFIKSKLEHERYLYTRACSAINNSDASLMPKEYREFIAECVVSADKNRSLDDICIQGFVERHMERLKKHCTQPSIWTIIFSWCHYKFRKATTLFKKKVPATDTIPNTSTIQNVSNVTINYSKEYADYLMEKSKRNGRYSIREFCKSNHYDCNAMIVWLKSRNTSKLNIL